MKRDPILPLFTFRPLSVWRNKWLVEGLTLCMEWAAELSETVGLPVSIKMQRSSKTKELALLVECGRKSFSFHSQHPRVVLSQVSQQVFRQIERFHAQQEKEPAPRTPSRKRHRRKGSAGLRRS